jgi:uncharacterized protein (DUF305 family)
MTGRARWIVAGAVAIALLAVGYLGGYLTPSLAAPGDNSAEAGFARDMSVHHAQAVQMSMIEAQSGTMPEVRGLAQSIALTQQAQIGMMTVWLQDWHLNPTGSQPRMAWMPQGSEELVNGLMPGMATQDQINQLIAAKGKQVDILYCQLMLRHHLGGIHMVEGLLAVSHNKTVRALAETMLTGQQGEIADLQLYLQQLGAQPLPA